jgi:hypothetical protein
MTSLFPLTGLNVLPTQSKLVNVKNTPKKSNLKMANMRAQDDDNQESVAA